MRRPTLEAGGILIRAVTFDLWDTIVIDDSDEATREAMGLLTKGEARRAAFVQEMIRWTGVTEFQAEEGYVYAGQWVGRSGR